MEYHLVRNLFKLCIFLRFTNINSGYHKNDLTPTFLQSNFSFILL